MCVQVAVSLKGMAKVGKVNCEKYRQLCSQAGITGYPTIRYQLTNRTYSSTIHQLADVIDDGKSF